MKPVPGYLPLPDHSKTRRDDIAASWVVRKHNAPLTTSEQALLERWLAEDVRNQGAFIRAEIVWRATDRAVALRPDGTARAEEEPGGVVRRGLTRRRSVSAAAAAAALLCWPRTSRERECFYTTRDYTMDRIAVAGGQVSLDCYSQIRAHGTGVDHLSGRCGFSFPEASVVTVPGLRAVLRGRLQTSLDGERSSVLLLSGEARVRDARHGGEVVLRPGEEIEAGAAGILARRLLSSDDMAMKTSWMKGVLELSGQSLSEAADILNRYNRKKIFVHGAARSRVLMGSFSLHDPDAFVDAARSVLRIDRVSTSGRTDLY